MKQKTSSRKSGRRALTLIEVIASIGLLSTLLVVALLSHGKLAKQSSQDRRRIVAMDLTDSLVRDWTANGVIIPLNENGIFPSNDSFLWRTERKPTNDLPRGVQIVRLFVSHHESTEPLFHIDLAAPDAGDAI